MIFRFITGLFSLVFNFINIKHFRHQMIFLFRTGYGYFRIAVLLDAVRKPHHPLLFHKQGLVYFTFVLQADAVNTGR